jgi:hypothetical protein
MGPSSTAQGRVENQAAKRTGCPPFPALKTSTPTAFILHGFQLISGANFFVKGLYDEDGELKKQLDALLKKEEHLQKLFDEQEEARGATQSSTCMLSNAARHPSHVTRHTSHVTRHTSHVTRHTLHLTRHTSHVTPHTSHLTRHTSHVTRHTSHVTRHTSHVTGPIRELQSLRSTLQKSRNELEKQLRLMTIEHIRSSTPSLPFFLLHFFVFLRALCLPSPSHVMLGMTVCCCCCC